MLAATQLKERLEDALLLYESASLNSFIHHAPGMLVSIDLLMFGKGDFRGINALRKMIDEQDSAEALVEITQQLLNSTDSVLRYCVATALSANPVDLSHKDFNELYVLAQQIKSEQLIETTKKELHLPAQRKKITLSRNLIYILYKLMINHDRRI